MESSLKPLPSSRILLAPGLPPSSIWKMKKSLISSTSNSKDHKLAYNALDHYSVSNYCGARYCLALGIKAKTQLCPRELILYCGNGLKIKTQEKLNTDQCAWMPETQHTEPGRGKMRRRCKRKRKRGGDDADHGQAELPSSDPVERGSKESPTLSHWRSWPSLTHGPEGT